MIGENEEGGSSPCGREREEAGKRRRAFPGAAEASNRGWCLGYRGACFYRNSADAHSALVCFITDDVYIKRENVHKYGVSIICWMPKLLAGRVLMSAINLKVRERKNGLMNGGIDG